MKSKKKTTTAVAGATPGIKEILGQGQGSTESRPTHGKTIDVPGGVSGQGELMTVRHGQCRPSPTQPRQVFGRIEELAESIRALGVQERLLVRPRPPAFTLHEPDLTREMWTLIDKAGKEETFVSESLAVLAAGGEEAFKAWYEIVDGERRWRAADAAGLNEVPAEVREMADADVVKYQLVSFAQKEGLNEMDEGAAFRRLLQEGLHTVESLVELTGKSRSHIFGRMALLKLEGTVLKAYQAGEINASLAGVVSQVRGQKQQAKFLERVKSEKLSVRDAQEAVKNDFTLDLKDARFDQGDGELFQAAGACKTCPKRSGNNREEFPESEFKSPDVCTDPTCFHKKRKLHLDLLLAAAERDGMRQVPEKNSLFYSGSNLACVGQASKYMKADEVCPHDKKKRTWRQLVQKYVERWAALDLNGDVQELYLREQGTTALGLAGVKVKVQTESEQGRLLDAEPTEAQKRKKLLDERLDAAKGVAMAEAVFERAKVAKNTWAAMVELMSIRMDIDWRACLRGKELKPLDKMDEAALRCVALEVVLGDDYSDGLNDEFVSRAAELLAVDVKKIEKQAKAAFEEANRLPKNREKIEIDDERLLAEVEQSRSTEKISDGAIAKPFEFRGYWWVQTGSVSGGGEPVEHDVMQVVPVSEYKKEKFTYSHKSHLSTTMSEAERESFYEGVLVKYGPNEYVLTGPKFCLVGPAEPELPGAKFEKAAAASKAKGAKSKVKQAKGKKK